MLLPWRANLADHVSRTIPSSQYETNLWSTHVHIVWLAEPIRRCVRWRTQVFKIEGFVCKRFLPSPPLPPLSFFGSRFISRGAKTENHVACVASVSNRVIARKLERRQKKKVEGGGGGEKRFLHSAPPPPSFIFFCSCPSFLDEPREETLATQAKNHVPRSFFTPKRLLRRLLSLSTIN